MVEFFSASMSSFGNIFFFFWWGVEGNFFAVFSLDFYTAFWILGPNMAFEK